MQLFHQNQHALKDSNSNSNSSNYILPTRACNVLMSEAIIPQNPWASFSIHTLLNLSRCHEPCNGGNLQLRFNCLKIPWLWIVNLATSASCNILVTHSQRCKCCTFVMCSLSALFCFLSKTQFTTISTCACHRCGTIPQFSGLDTTGTNLGSNCPNPPCE